MMIDYADVDGPDQDQTLPLFDQEPEPVPVIQGATEIRQMLSHKVPARARRTDPETSKAAAASWDSHKLTATQTFVLSFFMDKGSGTDAEMEEWVERTYPNEKFGFSSLRKRRGDLVEKGVLRDSGRRDEQRRMIIWELVTRRHRDDG